MRNIFWLECTFRFCIRSRKEVVSIWDKVVLIFDLSFVAPGNLQVWVCLDTERAFS